MTCKVLGLVTKPKNMQKMALTWGWCDSEHQFPVCSWAGDSQTGKACTSIYDLHFSESCRARKILHPDEYHLSPSENPCDFKGTLENLNIVSFLIVNICLTPEIFHRIRSSQVLGHQIRDELEKFGFWILLNLHAHCETAFTVKWIWMLSESSIGKRSYTDALGSSRCSSFWFNSCLVWLSC